MHALWNPSAEKISSANITTFTNVIQKKYSLSSIDLHQWSIEHAANFWSSFWNYIGIKGEQGTDIISNYSDIEKSEWFPHGSLNFAENLLSKNNNDLAIVSYLENDSCKRYTYAELHSAVSSVIQALQKLGVTKGDRVAACMPNVGETVICLLATTAIGAIWTSVSPDFGTDSIVDRFSQTTPKVFISCDGYFYNGKTFPIVDKITEIKTAIHSIQSVIVVEIVDVSHPYHSFQKILIEYPPKKIIFEKFPFNHPLYIMYSSGTTGKPKCIVHGAGGTLIQHMKEHHLHCDAKENDRIYYFTTCGWMMWNWLVSFLASKCTIILYDGSPFYPTKTILWEIAEKEHITLFGTSAKYIDGLKKENISIKKDFSLHSLRTICSTGSVLIDDSFDYVYEHIKKDVCLSSISGGTDIISCFLNGNPTLPVYRGFLQCKGFAMNVQVFDDNGKQVVQSKGELVCVNSFPSKPIYFWNDPTGEKFHNSYFKKYKNVWTHGDWVEENPNGQFTIFGRSDATLNPGGVRIGTAEIYQAVEQIHEVIECIAVGQDWDGDVRIILFVVLKKDLVLHSELVSFIKQKIKTRCSPRHIPAKVLQVKDIPRTKSGKISEIVVRNIIHNIQITNLEALANPESLEEYKNIEALKNQ